MEKTAVISGAGGALGSVLVHRFLREGFTTEGLYRSHTDKIGNPNFTSHSVDLMNEKDTEQVVKNILDKRKSIQTLVCSAGGFKAGDINKTDLESLQKQYQINFITAYNLVRPVYLSMKEKGHGRIFLIGSRQGLDGVNSTGALAYGLSKSLLFHLAKSLNKDAEGKVVVSVVVPSTIDTADNRKWMPDEDFTKWVTPDQIADAILFYSSEAASAIRQPVIKLFNQS